MKRHFVTSNAVMRQHLSPCQCLMVDHLPAKAAAGSRSQCTSCAFMKKQVGFLSKYLRRISDAATMLRSSPIAADQQPSVYKSLGGKSRQAMHASTLGTKQLQAFANASVGAALERCPTEVFRCIELMSMELLGAATARLLYVSHWHQKLLYFAGPDSCDGEQPQTGVKEKRTASQLPLLRVVCNVGEGIAGAVAHSGRPESILDCSVHKSATGKDRGSMVSYVS
jgi:hypothetical protein